MYNNSCINHTKVNKILTIPNKLPSLTQEISMNFSYTKRQNLTQPWTITKKGTDDQCKRTKKHTIHQSLT